MPTKTDRILSYLPFTFLASRRQSALRALAASVGNELQHGETALARIMRSHWVDSADEGALLIADLEQIASMYGLAPLRDLTGEQLETVEQFRRRLKRYVRTLLQGRVTVRGLLNVAAEILDVTIPESDGLDVWWKRRQRETITVEPRGEDAATLIFGRPAIDVRGTDAEPAMVQGTVDLSQGVNLENGSQLRLQIDQDPPHRIDLVAGVPDIRSVPLLHILNTINAKFPGAASHDGRFLTIRSKIIGADGRIEFQDEAGDAASAVFGVPSHIYTGGDARPAQVRSTVNLGGGADLTRERFLRIVVDGSRRAEIDCAKGAGGATTLNDIRDAINEALSPGPPVASHKDGLLLLSSPTTGNASSIFLQEPAAQSITRTLLGPQASFFLGADARPAIAAGVRDLGAGIDLSQRSLVRVAIDGAAPVTVNCAGAEPAETRPDEIVKLLNAALGPGAAALSQGRVQLSSSTSGKTGQIVFEPADPGDALDLVFGFGPRVFRGTPALPASLSGAPFPEAPVSALPKTIRTAALKAAAAPAPGAPGAAPPQDEVGVNLLASYRLAVQLDQNPPVEFDLPRERKVTPLRVADAIDAALKQDIAFSTANSVGLTSRTSGSGSRIAIVPLEHEVRRRFVTRAAIQDEAALLVLGFSERSARGQLATSARVTSKIDLQFGADLRTERWLNVSIDGAAPITVDCAGPRPRTTTIEEVAARLRKDPPDGLGPDHVGPDGQPLTLVSTATGSGSRISFEPVRIQDAAPGLLGVEPGERRGQEAGRVVFTSTVDLSKGIDLAPDARVKIGVDAVSPAEVTLNNGTTPARKTLNEIITAINGTVAATVASHDGRFLTLASRERGAASKLLFRTATGTDVTKALFGFAAPRSYQADEAAPAVMSGQKDLPAKNDLGVARFLRASVDGRAAFVIDCAGDARSDQLATRSPDDIKTAINNAFAEEADRAGPSAASGLANLEGNRLVLRSSTVGAASRIAIQPYIAGDAKAKLFGDVPDQTQGRNGVPAEIVGEVPLLKPVDLSRFRKLLLSVDAGRPVEIDIAGEAPSETTLTDIVDAIERALPGVASATAERFLRLTAVSAGSGSTLEVLPRRYIELIEHPLFDQQFDAGVVPHGSPIVVHNAGVEDSVARVEIASLNGTVDPAVVNYSFGKRIGLNGALRPGEKVVFEQDGDFHITAAIALPDGGKRALPGSSLVIENAEGHPSGAGLELPRGDSTWSFMECLGPRFNAARFNQERFPGSFCQTVGIFDISRFDGPGPDQSIFAPHPAPEASAAITFRWRAFQGGALELNLPAELRPVFGGRFNQSRFGLGVVVVDPDHKPPILKPRIAEFSGVVFDPKGDPDYIVDRLDQAEPRDFVVEGDDVLTNVPLGFVANRVPFRTPRFLTRGDEKEPARIFLLEPDSGNLIELRAAQEGDWGNQVSVAVRPDGPGRFQLEIGFAGDRFESARSLVLGPPEGAETTAAAGVLRARAAGVSVRVTRDRTGDSK